MNKHQKSEAAILALTAEVTRLKHKLAIEQDRVAGLTMSVDYYKRAFYIEFARTTPLTSTVRSVELGATKEEKV